MYIEGAQSMPPQNTPLWSKDYLELEATEKEETQEKLCALPFLPGNVGQFLITGDNFRLLPAQRWHQRHLQNKPY